MIESKREVAGLKPLATFLTEHGIGFDTSKRWVIYGRYYYSRLVDLLYAEDLWGLMTIIYKVSPSDVSLLEAEPIETFHKLGLVKK